MSQLITLGSELIRINPQNTTRLQYSYNQGRSWLDRYIGSTPGRFLDLQRDVLFQRFRPHLAI